MPTINIHSVNILLLVTTLPVLDNANHLINHYLVDCFIYLLTKWGLLFNLVFKHKYHMYFWMTDNTEEALIPSRFSVGVALSFLGGDKLSTALAVFVTTKVDCTYSVNQQYTIFKECIGIMSCLINEQQCFIGFKIMS